MAADTTTSPLRPDARFLVSHPAHFIALGFGAGLSPVAPGTVGTAVSVVIGVLAAQLVHPLIVAFCAIPLFLVGIWACDVTGRDLGVADHGSMVWDEIVAFLPLAALASAGVITEAVAFLLFRLFDVWKPFPIRELERHVKGGLGVMIDDVVAAFYAYICFALFIVVMVKGFGFS
jgi:phosphatidylglycerophosphatase A